MHLVVLDSSLDYYFSFQMNDIANGKIHCPKLHGEFDSRTDSLIPEAVKKAEENYLNKRRNCACYK